MATKRRKLYLYLCLALVCFIGLMATYFVDGYMGIYDTVYITVGERKQSSIELYQWLQGEGRWTSRVRWGEEIKFEYKIDNRRFSTYSADVEVSVQLNQEKVCDLLSQHIAVAPFDKEQLNWVLDTVELEPSGAPSPKENYKYIVIIKNGELERQIKLYVSCPPI